jgi:hypothetical protein
MAWVGFEHTTPVFEREKTVHASDCAANVIGYNGPNTVHLELINLKRHKEALKQKN